MNIGTRIWKCLRIVLLIAAILLSIFVLLATLLLIYLKISSIPYETNDIDDYGIIKGNSDNDTPKEFVSSFFPDSIDESFENVVYHYKADRIDSYAYEISLEFTIANQQEYSDYKATVTNNAVCEPFKYAPEYDEFCVDDFLQLEPIYGSTVAAIDQARIGLILFSDSEQRIVYIAMGVYDGGGATTEDLNYFFDRFNINPWHYEKRV